MRNDAFDAVRRTVGALLHMISHTRAPSLAPQSPAASFFLASQDMHAIDPSAGRGHKEQGISNRNLFGMMHKRKALLNQAIK
jgi:hypothetical protein